MRNWIDLLESSYCISEAVEEITVGHGSYETAISVLRNPTVAALENLGANSSQGIVRFILWDNKVWFWKGYDGTHVAVGEKLGLDVYGLQPNSRDPMTGVMRMEHGSYDFEVGHINTGTDMSAAMTKAQWKALCSHPTWARYADKMGLYPCYRDMDL